MSVAAMVGSGLWEIMKWGRGSETFLFGRIGSCDWLSSCPRWVKYCEDKCYKTDVPLMFLFSLPAHLPFWVLSHYEEAQGPQLYGYPVLGFPTPRIMSLSNSPCLWMIHSQVFCYGTEKRLRSLPTSPFIRNPHRTSSDCSKWVPRVS